MDAVEEWNKAMALANANLESRRKDAQRLMTEAKEIYDNDIRRIQENWDKKNKLVN